jgi:hypothetical protein
MRKVTVAVQAKLTLNMDDKIEVGEVIGEMEYSFADTTNHAEVEDAEILDFQIADSR